VNKARKRRQRRRERDLRWAQREGATVLRSSSHREKKVLGVPEIEGVQYQAFWCRDTDPMPRIARLWFCRAN